MKVLVVGDVIIDEYTHGTKRGISAETPTVVANFKKVERFVGGAALVARNLLRLGNDVGFLTMAGNESINKELLRSSDPLTFDEVLKFNPFVIHETGWRFSEKRRYFVENYKLLQYDLINEGEWNGHCECSFLDTFENLLPKYDAVVASDNRHGVFSEYIAQRIVSECKRNKKPLYVDSQISQSASNHKWYKGADFVFLNELEADCVSKNIKRKKKESQLDSIMKFLKSDIVYKRGERGAIRLSRNKKLPDEQIYCSGFVVNAIDTCGAGDAFLAAFVSSGNDLHFANKWAALSTTYRGTIVPKIQDLNKNLVQRA